MGIVALGGLAWASWQSNQVSARPVELVMEFLALRRYLAVAVEDQWLALVFPLEYMDGQRMSETSFDL